MDGYWWGLLTIPLALVLIGAASLILWGVWYGLATWADGKFVSLQGSGSWTRKRADEAVWLLAAPKAWSLEIGKRCAVIVTAGSSTYEQRLPAHKALSQIDDGGA